MRSSSPRPMPSDGSLSPLPSLPWSAHGQHATKPVGVLRTPASLARNLSRCGSIPDSWLERDAVIAPVRLRPGRLGRPAGLHLPDGILVLPQHAPQAVLRGCLL